MGVSTIPLLTLYALIIRSREPFRNQNQQEDPMPRRYQPGPPVAVEHIEINPSTYSECKTPFPLTHKDQSSVIAKAEPLLKTGATCCIIICPWDMYGIVTGVVWYIEVSA